ncbi:MAG TPA: hypothetical protein VIM29_03180 [Bacillota bacterium]
MLLLFVFTGCNRSSLISKSNREFQNQQSYISVYYLSRYNVITYQVVTPTCCVLLVYHIAAFTDGFNPQLVGVRVQDLCLGQESNIIITPAASRKVTGQLSFSAIQQVNNYFKVKKLQKSQFDCRLISLPVDWLTVQKVHKAATFTVEGEIRDLNQDQGFARLLRAEKAYFRIVLNPQNYLPVNEYYWSGEASIVRYLLFPKECTKEIQRLQRLRSLHQVQKFFEEKQIFKHIQLVKSP